MKKLKNKYSQLLVLFLAVLSIYSCDSSDSGNKIIEVIPATQFLNETYGSEVNQDFDIYLPADRTLSTPVIVMLHGGFWSVGDKEEMNTYVSSA